PASAPAAPPTPPAALSLPDALPILPPAAPRSELERVRRDLGLDRPLPVQYAVFLRNTVRLDFGRSLHFREPATDVVRGYIGATRSEEHTSELQSPGHIVRRLLPATT